MKRLIFVLAMVMVVSYFFMWCGKENVTEPVMGISDEVISYEMKDIEAYQKALGKVNINLVNEIRLKYFAKALAKELTDRRVCRLLKEEIGKKFDGDYDVLWEKVKGRAIGERGRFRDLVERRLGGKRALIGMDEIEEVPLLQISCPVNFDKWDGESPVLVAYEILTIDDMEWKEVYAYDADGNEYTLDAWKEPEFPVIVVGRNERNFILQNVSGQYVGEPAGKVITNTSGNPLYLEWWKTDYDHDPWPKGKGEFKFMVLSDCGKSVEKNYYEVREDKWYHPRQFLFKYYKEIGKYLTVEVYEMDAGGSLENVTLSINKPPISVSATFNIKSHDDYVGKNELVDISDGPLLTDRDIRPDNSTSYPCGSVNFTLWWVKMHDYEISLDPLTGTFVHYNTNVNKKDKWDVGPYGEPDGKDAAYLWVVENRATVDISTLFGYTTFNTMIEIFDKNGSTGIFARGDPVTGKASLHDITLIPGIYFLVVDGYNGATGNYKLEIKTIL